MSPSPPAPRIVIDPSVVNLLPDASLHLDLPPPFNVGRDRRP
jgi:hypothetical protein